MLKKIFAAILILSVFMIQPTAMAAYPKYLNGDRNYIMFDGHMGGARYLIRNSRNVEGEDPPAYIISVDWVVVPNADRGSTKISQRYHTVFGYNTNTRQAFTISNDGKFNQLNPNASRAEGSALVAAAEITFYLASDGVKFFGIFPDSFYPDL